MGPNGVTVRSIPKQFAVGLGIATLLPLTVLYGVTVFHPSPDTTAYYTKEQDFTTRIAQTTSEPEKQRLSREQEQHQKAFEGLQRRYYRAVFYVGYPVGLFALVAGAFVSIQAIGAGFMFGGLFTLSEACYCYWDRLGDPMRFGSLLVALAVIVATGYWMFRPSDAAIRPSDTTTNPSHRDP